MCYAQHFRDGLIAADGTELAKSFEAKRLRGFALQNSDEVERPLGDPAVLRIARGS